MKKLFNNSYLVISLYLLTTFIIDIMTNLSLNLSFSIGNIIRSIFLLYFILGLFIKYKRKENYIVLSLLLAYSIVYLIIHNSSFNTIFNYINIIVLLLYMYNLYKTEDKKVNRNMVTICVLLYSISIILSWITKSHFCFSSVAEVSAILSISLPYLFINLEKRINFIEIIAILLMLFASILIGTRLPLIVFLSCLLYLLIKKLIKDAKRKKVDYVNLIVFILLIGVLLFKFNSTPVYKNISNQFDKLNINNPVDVLTDYDKFDNIVFNGRLKNIEHVNKLMKTSTVKYKLVGLDNYGKEVRMDPFELLYRYGAIGLLVFSFSFILIYKSLKSNKEYNKFPLIIMLITSVTSGNVLLSPNVAIITVIILANTIYKRNHKKIFLAAYDMNAGGIESALLSYIKKLNSKNYEITLFLENKEGYLLKELPDDVIVKRQKVFNYKNPLIRKPLNMLNKIKFLLTNFKEYDFSACYATYSMSSNFMARGASNNSSIYIHSDYTALYKNDIKEINNFFDIRKLDKFKHIIFVSNESRDNLIAYYPRLMDKSVVINNFIDNEKINKLSLEEINDKKPRGKKLFVFVGRIDESSKNFTRMINSFKLVKEKTNKFELWIIGSGQDEKYVKKLIKDNDLEKYIKMLGKKTNPYPYIKLSDYIILTSNFEGFPVVYGEAITLGKPIITTIDVTDESISIPNNFGIVTMKSEEDIAKTILDVILVKDFKAKPIDIDDINNKRLEMTEKLILK